MDAPDILGALLGRKSGSGGDILRELLGGGRSGSAPARPSTPRQHPQVRRPQVRRPRTIDETANSLEEILNVSNDHHQQRRQSSTVIAIDLDEKQEAEYLADLAHGLRLNANLCNEIHRKLGAPAIFKTAS